ncbi:MAG: FAD-dependent oxidoreductase [Myxococcota bacterium]
MGALELTTRRQILAALLGAPWASHCRRVPSYDYDGRFIDDGQARGHALRDGRAPRTPPLPEKRTNVLILGAGAAGLVAGWRLRREGVDVDMLELASAPGGTAIGGASEVTRYPWGAHYLPAPTKDNPALIELLEDMEIVVDRDRDGTPHFDEAVLCASPRERVFYKGRWYPGLIPEVLIDAAGRRQMARFRKTIDDWIAFRGADGCRAFTIPVAACSEDPRVTHLDSMSMAQWMQKEQFTSPWVRAAVDYACRDDFGARPEDVSAWYGLHYFAARTPNPGAASQPFLTWPQGNARLIEHLAQRVGSSRIHLNTVVTAVRLAAGGWQVDTVDIATGRARRWLARQVICALPSFLRHHIFPERLAPAYDPPYGAWMVANLHLRGRPRSEGFETSWDNVMHASPSLGYVVATHQQGSAYGPTVWTWYLPLVGADPRAERRRLQQLTWADAADVAVSELDASHGDLARHLTRVDLRRWGHAMVRPAPGMAFGSARRAASQSLKGLHFAHADLSGVALFEEAFYHGDRAAQAVIAARGSAR